MGNLRKTLGLDKKKFKAPELKAAGVVPAEGATKAAPAPAADVQPVAAPKEKKPPKEPKEVKDLPRYACGHVAELQNDCLKCVRKRRAKLMAQKRTDKPTHKDQCLKGRLPHGASFAGAYDGEKQEWAVTLEIPTEDGKRLTLRGVHSGILRLLCRLDDQYREVLAGTLALGEKKNDQTA